MLFTVICSNKRGYINRIEIYKSFKEGAKRILVTTNLIARGIDVDKVNLVINYDMPESAETYLHRVT